MSTPDATTVGAATVAALLRHGVRTMYGVGGTHTVPLLGDLERSGAINFVAARTELGAAYMAIGHARATGRPGVVLTSTGPGALNTVGALADADWSAVPLLHVTTTIGGEGFAGAVHETPRQAEILGLAGRRVVLVEDDDVETAIEEAWAYAAGSPPGPVTVEVPAGRWQAATGPRRPPAGAPVPAPDAAQSVIDNLAEALRRASRPLVYAGGGATRHDGGAAVLALAEHVGAPLVTSYQGKGIGDWSHPRYLGPWSSEERVRELCAAADVAVVFGAKLSAGGTDQWRLPLPQTAYRVGFEQRPHPHYPQLREVRGDAATVASAVTAALGRRTGWAASDVSALQAEVAAAARRRGPLEMDFVDVLVRGAGTPAVVSTDMTKAGFWIMKHLPVAPGGRHAFSSYLAMGTGLPMAIGLSVASDAPVLAVVGDGALQMSLAELAVVAERRLPITLIVIVDGAYGMLAENAAAVGGSEALGLTLWNPDLVGLARAFELPCYETTVPEELAPLLDKPAEGPRMILAHQPFSRRW